MTTTEAPPREVLAGAAAAGVITAACGVIAAGAAGSGVAILADDGSFLSGLLEGLVAGLVVLVAAAILTVAAVRRWVARRHPSAPGWGWATLAVMAGAAACAVVWSASAALADAVADGLFLLALLSPLAAGVAAYGVLRAWAAR